MRGVIENEIGYTKAFHLQYNTTKSLSLPTTK
jgi:hypothetical protein